MILYGTAGVAAIDANSVQFPNEKSASSTNEKLWVSFVPNVLCLYRHHEKAMSNATNLFELELVGRLFDKYRRLIESYSPQRRILGVTPLQFEEAVRTVSEKRKPAVSVL